MSGVDRGAVETTGVVLLIGLVITSATLVFVAGGDVISAVQEQTKVESGEVVVQDIDARFGSIASSPGDAVTTLELGDKSPDEFSVTRDGRLNVSVDGGACSASIRLTTVTYETRTGEQISYQAGGVWRRTPDGGSVMVAPPDVTFQEGSVSITVVNATGGIRDDRVAVTKNATASSARTSALRERLYADGCQRPTNVTLNVTSDFPNAWRTYLGNEFDHSVNVYGRTASLTLASEDLPESVDDSKNRVVDLSDPDIVDPDATNHRIADPEFTIDKSVGNSYFVAARPIENGTTVSEIREFSDGTAYRKPFDVVIVIDESGSMQGSKAADAKAAAKEFVGLTRGSDDRIALVGYTSSARYLLVNGSEFFASHPDSINATIDQFDADGGTAINRGLNASLALQDVESNASQTRHVILLTDGRNEPYLGCDATCRAEFDERTLDGARLAADQDIVVHTIAFGSSPDSDLLKDVKDITGGTYSEATTSTGLKQVFESIFQNITETEQIVRRPVSTELTIGGQTFVPQTVGNDSNVARYNQLPNVNDPAAPGDFTYTVSTDDGALVDMSAVELSCADWSRTAIEHENESSGKTYNVVRCTNTTGIERQISPANVTVLLNGADVSSYQGGTEAWWQPDLYNDTLGPYRDASGTLTLESNQALVIYRFPASQDGDGDNRLVMLYEFGLSDSTRSENVIDLNVAEVEIDD